MADGFTGISNEDLDSILRDILGQVACGETYMIGALKGM